MRFSPTLEDLSACVERAMRPVIKDFSLRPVEKQESGLWSELVLSNGRQYVKVSFDHREGYVDGCAGSAPERSESLTGELIISHPSLHRVPFLHTAKDLASLAASVRLRVWLAHEVLGAAQGPAAARAREQENVEESISILGEFMARSYCLNETEQFLDMVEASIHCHMPAPIRQVLSQTWSPGFLEANRSDVAEVLADVVRCSATHGDHFADWIREASSIAARLRLIVD